MLNPLGQSRGISFGIWRKRKEEDEMKSIAMKIMAVGALMLLVASSVMMPAAAKTLKTEYTLMGDDQDINGVVKVDLLIYEYMEDGTIQLFAKGWLKLLPSGNALYHMAVMRNGEEVEIEDLTQILDPNNDYRAEGRILVHSDSELLDELYENNTSFQVILSIMQDSYPEGLEIFYLDMCHVDDREFQLDSHGYALTTYSFNAGNISEC
jgi:hypothetical protein